LRRKSRYLCHTCFCAMSFTTAPCCLLLPVSLSLHQLDLNMLGTPRAALDRLEKVRGIAIKGRNVYAWCVFGCEEERPCVCAFAVARPGGFEGFTPPHLFVHLSGRCQFARKRAVRGMNGPFGGESVFGVVRLLGSSCLFGRFGLSPEAQTKGKFPRNSAVRLQAKKKKWGSAGVGWLHRPYLASTPTPFASFSPRPPLSPSVSHSLSLSSRCSLLAFFAPL